TVRPEGDDGRGRELQVAGRAAEQLVVLGVGARPTRLDVVHPEPVELLGDAQLVLDGQRDPLELRPVPQGRVIDLDALRHAHTRSHHSLYLSTWPRTARPYSPAITSVMGPGHAIGRSSTELTALTSAAVPHTNISSAT